MSDCPAGAGPQARSLTPQREYRRTCGVLPYVWV